MNYKDYMQTDDILKHLAGQHALPIVVRGDCMRPLIHHGARLFIEPENFYWPGDIIVFRNRHGQLVTHRLLGSYRYQGELRHITRADTSLQPDEVIRAGQILGRVTDGECHPDVTDIPAPARLRALAGFASVMLQKLLLRFAPKY